MDSLCLDTINNRERKGHRGFKKRPSPADTLGGGGGGGGGGGRSSEVRANYQNFLTPQVRYRLRTG